jgi:hypothetical protein
MPYSYTIAERIVHVCWSGDVSKRDLDAFGEEMPRIGWQLGFAPDVLHTFAEVTSGLPPIEAFLYSQRQDQVPIPNPMRAAIVINTEECEALANVFRALDATSNLTMKVFPTEAEARRWLARR